MHIFCFTGHLSNLNFQPVHNGLRTQMAAELKQHVSKPRTHQFLWPHTSPVFTAPIVIDHDPHSHTSLPRPNTVPP